MIRRIIPVTQTPRLVLNASEKFWLAFLVAWGIGIRIAFWFVSEPREFPDTGTYIEVAKQLLSGDFNAYEGRRTFGYPALLLVAQQSPQVVWLLQMTFGLAISVLLFFLAHDLTGSAVAAFAAGMTYNLNLGLLFFEGNLIPETQTIFFIISSLAAVTVAFLCSTQKYTNLSLLFSGVLAGCAVLARPQFVFMPLFLSVWVGYWYWRSVKLRRQEAVLVGFVIGSPGVLMILATASFNYIYLGSFNLSTQTGVNLMEHTIAYVELAPDRYRAMRDVLIKHRDMHLAKTGRHTATWNAVPELKRVLGLPSQVALDRELVKLSSALVFMHPYRYLVLVFDAWLGFWAAPNPKGIDAVRPVQIAALLERIWRLEQLMLRAANAFFLFLVVAAAVSRQFRMVVGWGSMLTALAAVILLSATFQAFVIGVDNARYGVTVQPLISLLVVTVLYRLWNARTVQTSVQVSRM